MLWVSKTEKKGYRRVLLSIKKDTMKALIFLLLSICAYIFLSHHSSSTQTGI